MCESRLKKNAFILDATNIKPENVALNLRYLIIFVDLGIYLNTFVSAHRSPAERLEINNGPMLGQVWL